MKCGRYISILLLLFFAGCAQVPPQTVELSATLGKDLEDLHRSHRKAVDLLHDRNVDIVNRYIQDVVVPIYVKAAVDGVGLLLIADIQRATAATATDEDRKRAYEHMLKTVLGVNSRVEKQRQEMLVVVEEARRAQLQELDMSYAQIQRANATLTAYLGSLAKVSAVQDEALQKLGLKNFKEKLGDDALESNKKVEQALKSATGVEDSIGKLKEFVDTLKK